MMKTTIKKNKVVFLVPYKLCKDLSLIFLLIILIGCVSRSPENVPLANESTVSSDTNSQIIDSNVENLPNELINEAEQPEQKPSEFNIVITANEIYQNSFASPLSIQPFCWDDACVYSLDLTDKVDWGRPINVELYKDYFGLPGNEYDSKSGSVFIPFFKGPVRNENCFIVSESQYKKYLRHSDIAGFDIGSYCKYAKKMGDLSGLNFDGNFIFIVYEVPNPEAAAFYAGSRTFMVDRFSLGGQKIWLVVEHEFVHHAARNLNLPSWFEEGLADYLAYTVNKEPIRLPPIPANISNWNPKDSNLETWEHSRNYNYVSWIIQKFVQDYNSTSLQKLLKNYGDFNVSYDLSTEQKNKFLEKAMQQTIGKLDYNLEQFSYPVGPPKQR